MEVNENSKGSLKINENNLFVLGYLRYDRVIIVFVFYLGYFIRIVNFGILVLLYISKVLY